MPGNLRYALKRRGPEVGLRLQKLQKLRPDATDRAALTGDAETRERTGRDRARLLADLVAERWRTPTTQARSGPRIPHAQ